MNKITLKTTVIFALLSLIISSCSNPVVYQESQKIENNSWDRFKKLDFNIPINQKNQVYDIKLNLQYNANIAYSILPIYVILTTSSGEERMREYFVEIKKDGRYIGKGKGDNFETNIMLWEEISLPDIGTCNINIENKVPRFETDGICEVGIELIKTKKSE